MNRLKPVFNDTGRRGCASLLGRYGALRHRIYMALIDRQLSVRGLAIFLGAKPEVVRHRVKELLDRNIIEVAGTISLPWRRGGPPERVYRLIDVL